MDTASAFAAPSDAPAAQSIHPAEYVGRRGDFLRLVMRGSVFELFTAGFYRFWLVTDIRRHLWTHTGVAGDTLEYTGRGRELLIGFLIALAILGPAYIVYFLVGLVAESMQALASLPLIILLYLFGYFASYRARRYRLTRTVWRGVRFWMTGSAWAYMAKAVGWGILVAITLGGALPWRDAALERYKMQHTHYGDLAGNFTATGGTFFRSAWWLWLLAPFAALLVVPLPFLIAAFRARQWRWWVSGLRIGDMTFTSSLPSKALFGVYWKAIGWSALALLALSAITGALTYAYTGGVAEPAAILLATREPGFLVGVVVAYLLTIFCINAVVRLYLVHDIWRAVVRSIAVSGLESAHEVNARGTDADAVGEGLSDGLDVGGF